MAGVDKAAEVAIMQGQNARYDAKARDGLKKLSQQVEIFSALFSTIKALHSGISVTKVMADIEVAKIDGAQTSSLSAIVDELAQFLKSEQGRLHRMMIDVGIVGLEVRRAADSMGQPVHLPVLEDVA